jgi:hypothetical protein
VVGAIVGVVALVGGGFALLGGSKDSDPRPGFSDTPGATVPVGVPVLDPTVGPQPAEPSEPEPLPGPGPAPVVTVAPPTTQPPEPALPPLSGDAVTLSDGTGIVPADGWSVAKESGGFIQLNADGGGAQVYLSRIPSTGGGVDLDASMRVYLEEAVAPYIAELEVTDVTPQGSIGAGVVSVGTLEYRGLLAAQSGSLPVEGFIVVFVKADGSVIVYEEMNQQGTYDEHEAALGSMLNSVVQSLKSQ